MKNRALMGWALLALLASPVAASPASDKLRDAVRSWREANESKLLAEYSVFAALPSIASNLADVDRNADYLEAQLKARGFTAQQLRARPGTPASVFAERRTPGAKRNILLYAHYDGQPVNQPGWLDPPFQPTLRTAPPTSAKVDLAAAAAIDSDWRLHGRATADDKSTIAVTLWALDPDAAMRKAHPKLLKLNWGDGGSVAVKVALDTPAAKAVIDAITRAGSPPVQMPLMGGTTPFAEIVEALGAPMIGIAVANADDNQHAANENIRLGNLWDGIEIYAALLADTRW